ncbi:MAG: hypothetical protein VX589_16785, partial [Myxococcota bacterium]|nr:hypothetical protein [Myxococcota bacterium]
HRYRMQIGIVDDPNSKTSFALPFHPFGERKRPGPTRPSHPLPCQPIRGVGHRLSNRLSP